MDPADDLLRDLQEALELSPENVTLRAKVGEILLRRGRADEAVTVFRAGLAGATGSERLRLGLARAFFATGNDPEAMVLAESLLDRPEQRAAALLLTARLHVRAADFDRAAVAYRRAVQLDPALSDETLSEVLDMEPADDRVDAEFDGGDPSAGLPGVDGLPDLDPDGRRYAYRVADDGNEDDGPETERPTITFEDVGGLDALKEQIRMKVIHPRTHRELYEAYGKTAGGGVLLYGPPGCGKTHIARATAGEVGAGFISVGLSDILDMYIGQSEKRLHAIFERARREAPSVLFFDEVDALAASRSDMRQSGARHLINQFLSEMDGADASNDGVLMLGATNAPWHLDPAFRRPGRFDQIVFVPPPDRPGRAAILRVLLRDIPAADVDHEAIAKKTREFSGADLKAVIDVAVETALTEAMRRGSPAPITTKQLLSGAKARRPSTAEWFGTARNYANFANESGAYDDVLRYLESKR